MIVRRALLSGLAGLVLASLAAGDAMATPSAGPLTITGVTRTSAVLDGAVHPGATPTLYHLEYGPTTGYGSSTPDPELVKNPFACTPDMSFGACVAGEIVNAQVTLSLSSLSAGTTYHVRLVAHDADGTGDGPDATFTTAPPGPAPVDRTPPRLHGRAAVGAVLTCTPGDWSGASSFAFAWLRNGAAVADATDSEYDPGMADAGALIACRVTASSPGDADGTAQSSALRVAHEQLRVALSSHRAEVDGAGRARVRVQCLNVLERCRTTLALTLPRRHGHRRPPALAHTTLALAPGTSAKLTLTLTDGGRRRLERAPHGRLDVVARLGAQTQPLLLVG